MKECSIFVVRYVPDVVRDEGLNIGLLLHSPEEEYLDCLFTRDFSRIRRLHPQADLRFLRALQDEFEQQIKEHEAELEDYLRAIRDSYSNLIQVMEPRPCLLQDPRAELPELFLRYVGGRLTRLPQQDTRMRIKQALNAAFERAGILKHKLLEKRVPAETWTRKGDPFTFDFGYRAFAVAGKPNGHVKLIHALSLSRDPDIADLLALKFERVRDKEPEARLTVVVGGLPAPEDETAGYSHRVLGEHQVALQPLAQVEQFAQSVRQELLV